MIRVVDSRIDGAATTKGLEERGRVTSLCAQGLFVTIRRGIAPGPHRPLPYVPRWRVAVSVASDERIRDPAAIAVRRIGIGARQSDARRFGLLE
jgi:hypothetical protein